MWADRYQLHFKILAWERRSNVFTILYVCEFAFAKISFNQLTLSSLQLIQWQTAGEAVHGVKWKEARGHFGFWQFKRWESDCWQNDNNNWSIVPYHAKFVAREQHQQKINASRSITNIYAVVPVELVWKQLLRMQCNTSYLAINICQLHIYTWHCNSKAVVPCPLLEL